MLRPVAAPAVLLLVLSSCASPSPRTAPGAAAPLSTPLPLSTSLPIATPAAGRSLLSDAVPTTEPSAAGRSLLPDAVPTTEPSVESSGRPSAGPVSGCPAPRRAKLRRAPGAARTVALTFDDGPGPWTPKILDVLRAFHVPATFFDTGAHDEQFPAFAAATAADGHILGVHSWDHEYPARVPGGWSRGYLTDQFARTARLQFALTGQASCLVRTPGGFGSPYLVPVAESLGLTVVDWTVDTRDWTQPGHASAAEVRRILAAAEAGVRRAHPVILLHAAKASHEPERDVSSYRGNTVAALPMIIRFYLRHGYRFVGMLGDDPLPDAPSPSPSSSPEPPAG